MSHEQLMQGLSAQHLRFTIMPTESIVFGDQAGSALRGALYQVLSDNFCSERNGPLTPDHATRCPTCWLLAAEDETSQRGENTPRPLTVEPPLERHIYHRGQPLSFGFTLIGAAQNFLPYIARAVHHMGEVGIGQGRGRFQLVSMHEANPLLDVERLLLENNLVKKPTLQVTTSTIREQADALAILDPNRITLEFLTPLRLTHEKHLLKTPVPKIFIQRLLERCQSLAEHYSETPSSLRETWYETYRTLSQTADSLQIAYNDTQWVEARSGSRRQNRYTPIGGLIGRVRWEGEISPLLPWLLWGQSLHVGKNAVKGNGWYRIIKKL